ncbi:sulfatase-like hydrolase/transferase [Amphritea sp.]|uniref:sulfatase-like hydrolase/transferase n=1 Tax=Amphritea sp. TaxID=1872502 RepID=UPI003A953BA6
MENTNLVILLSDEHSPLVSGFRDDPFVSTPNLDRLANQGTHFTAAYSNSPICVPARAALATGLHTHQNEYWDNAFGYDGKKRSWGHVLQQEGVRVESIGKLHYKSAEDPCGFDQQHLPMHVKGPGMLWGLLRNPLPVFEKQAGGMLRPIGAGYSEYNQYDESITAKACHWLEQVSRENTERPWVLFVGLVAPHFPLTVPESFIKPYLAMDLPEPRLRPESGYVRHHWVADMAYSQPVDESLSADERRMALASYYGLISFMDRQVGLILDQLEMTGLVNNTRIIYSSDHGDNMGVRGLWGKCTMNDESAGIPMIISGPGIPRGHKVDTPVTLVDLYPTVLEAVGVEDRTPDQYDRSHSRSLLQMANDSDDADRLILAEYHAVGSRSAAYMLRNKRYKYIYYLDYEPELFDMQNDPGEEDNLAGLAEHAKTLMFFEQKLRSMLSPEAIDAKAKSDQAALIEQYGGREACLEGGPKGATPVPTLRPHEQ